MRLFTTTVLSLFLVAATTYAADLCDIDIPHQPGSGQAVAQTAAEGAPNETVLVRVDVLTAVVQQAYEDTCTGGAGIPVTPVSAAPGCLGVQAHVSFAGGHSVRLLGNNNGSDVILTNVRGLNRLLMLPTRNSTRFCRVVERNIPAPAPYNPEEWGTMCIPNGPDGEFVTEDVHISTLAYWQSLGGTVGACEGPTTPPAY